jgi:(E)-4-hydroxy-3-methylbut-2-enyl-diphosphate synthase
MVVITLANERARVVRRPCLEVKVGAIGVGGANPVRIQSMTNTDTSDVEGTVQQCIELALAGSELVRVTVPDEKSAQAVPLIKKSLLDQGHDFPLIGDFHYNGHLLLQKVPACAAALDKLRINPGNCGFGQLHDKNFDAFIKLAVDHDKPVRIGVNGGSLDQGLLTKMMDENTRSGAPKDAQSVFLDAMVESALISTRMAVEVGLEPNKIILSAKVSDVQDLIYVYRKLAAQTEQPLHLGLTEAGMGMKGVAATAAAFGVLLQQGIGDTIRTSLTPKVGSARSEEVQACKLILQTMGLRSFEPMVTSCPGCGRTTSTLFQTLSEETTAWLAEKMPEWRTKGYKGVEGMRVAVMGCIVNGPGESKHANIGISLPGTGEDPASPVYADGKQVAVLQGPTRLQRFREMIQQYVETHYAPGAQPAPAGAP